MLSTNIDRLASAHQAHIDRESERHDAFVRHMEVGFDLFNMAVTQGDDTHRPTKVPGCQTLLEMREALAEYLGPEDVETHLEVGAGILLEATPEEYWYT